MENDHVDDHVDMNIENERQEMEMRETHILPLINVIREGNIIEMGKIYDDVKNEMRKLNMIAFNSINIDIKSKANLLINTLIKEFRNIIEENDINNIYAVINQ